MGQAVAPARAGNQVHYERRRPEETTLYQVVQEHLESFLTQVQSESGASLPDFVQDEFDAFLECGILAHGFVRLRCPECAHEKLVAFSCKRRGFCPSCRARRMAQSAPDRHRPRPPRGNRGDDKRAHMLKRASRTGKTNATKKQQSKRIEPIEQRQQFRESDRRL